MEIQAEKKRASYHTSNRCPRNGEKLPSGGVSVSALILEELKGTIGKQQAKAVLGARALSCRRADSHAVKLCWCPNGEDEYELPAGNGTWSVLSTEACQGTVRPVHDMG